MTMTDDRNTETPDSGQAMPGGMAAWTEWCARRDNNIGPAELESDRRMNLLRAKQRLRGAIDEVADLQHELRTRKRRMVASDGLAYELDSPYFHDINGNDENYWRADAVKAQAALDAARPADEIELLQTVCQWRLQVATSLNTADTLAMNAHILRRQIALSRDQIRGLEADLTAASRVAPIEIPVKKK